MQASHARQLLMIFTHFNLQYIYKIAIIMGFVF